MKKDNLLINIESTEITTQKNSKENNIKIIQGHKEENVPIFKEQKEKGKENAIQKNINDESKENNNDICDYSHLENSIISSIDLKFDLDRFYNALEENFKSLPNNDSFNSEKNEKIKEKEINLNDKEKEKNIEKKEEEIDEESFSKSSSNSENGNDKIKKYKNYEFYHIVKYLKRVAKYLYKYHKEGKIPDFNREEKKDFIVLMNFLNNIEISDTIKFLRVTNIGNYINFINKNTNIEEFKEITQKFIDNSSQKISLQLIVEKTINIPI